jgi:hypothetical protein
MIINPLGFAGRSHQTARTRHGWSKALQLAPDLYPGVGGKRFRAALLQRAYEFAGGQGDAPASIIDAVESMKAGFKGTYLAPALSAGLIQYTLPDKPNSRMQKYALTEKGSLANAEG